MTIQILQDYPWCEDNQRLLSLLDYFFEGFFHIEHQDWRFLSFLQIQVL